jgi:hypothetical protein
VAPVSVPECMFRAPGCGSLEDKGMERSRGAYRCVDSVETSLMRAAPQSPTPQG